MADDTREAIYRGIFEVCDDKATAHGFCAASVDGYCIGGWLSPDGARLCHG